MILECVTYWCEFLFREKQMNPLHLGHTTTAKLLWQNGDVGLTWILCKLMRSNLRVRVSAEM